VRLELLLEKEEYTFHEVLFKVMRRAYGVLREEVDMQLFEMVTLSKIDGVLLIDQEKLVAKRAFNEWR
jgi:hypothetical protein